MAVLVFLSLQVVLLLNIYGVSGSSSSSVFGSRGHVDQYPDTVARYGVVGEDQVDLGVDPQFKSLDPEDQENPWRCGKQLIKDDKHARLRRIVGGKLAREGEFPWQAAILYLDTFRCGGTLIHPDWVVTAAHCMDDLALWPEYYQLVIGATNSHDNGNRFDVDKIVRHPGYENRTFSNDIALIHLKSPTNKPAKKIRPACLPISGDEFIGQECVVSGWGGTSEANGKPEQHLRKVMLKIQTRATCDQRWGKYFQTNHLCAGWPEGGRDMCSGDSGSPLACYGGGSWTIAGIASLGVGCGRPHGYGLYTRVQSYVPWIHEVIKKGVTVKPEVIDVDFIG